MADAPENPERVTPAPSAPASSSIPGTSASAQEPLRPVADRMVIGVLLKHGPAQFGFLPSGTPSYFITLRTERGERTLWSRGLERAVRESRTHLEIGQWVGVRENGIDPMTVVTRERDERSHVKHVTRHESPRPRWIVERREFFNERAMAAKSVRDPRVSRHEAVRNHPELEGVYWALDSAVKLASTRIADRPSRERFVQLVRESLAHTVERGVPLPGERRGAARPTTPADVAPLLDPLTR